MMLRRGLIFGGVIVVALASKWGPRAALVAAGLFIATIIAVFRKDMTIL